MRKKAQEAAARGDRTALEKLLKKKRNGRSAREVSYNNWSLSKDPSTRSESIRSESSSRDRVRIDCLAAVPPSEASMLMFGTDGDAVGDPSAYTASDVPIGEMSAISFLSKHLKSTSSSNIPSDFTGRASIEDAATGSSMDNCNVNFGASNFNSNMFNCSRMGGETQTGMNGNDFIFMKLTDELSFMGGGTRPQED